LTTSSPVSVLAVISCGPGPSLDLTLIGRMGVSIVMLCSLLLGSSAAQSRGLRKRQPVCPCGGHSESACALPHRVPIQQEIVMKKRDTPSKPQPSKDQPSQPGGRQNMDRSAPQPPDRSTADESRESNVKRNPDTDSDEDARSRRRDIEP
jgi:hypothetical protein